MGIKQVSISVGYCVEGTCKKRGDYARVFVCIEHKGGEYEKTLLFVKGLTNIIYIEDKEKPYPGVYIQTSMDSLLEYPYLNIGYCPNNLYHINKKREAFYSLSFSH